MSGRASRKMSAEVIARLRQKLGGSSYGRRRGITCPTCGLSYDAFRTGASFAQTRRDIIAIGVDPKTGKRKHGRRNTVLGMMHAMKQQLWSLHVEDCERSAPWEAAS